jgi:hypothetical protein
LSRIYKEQAPEVPEASPDYLLWADDDENHWLPVERTPIAWRWIVEDGWLDCIDGCDCWRVYEFEVDWFGTVELLSYYEFLAPWCEDPGSTG